MTSRSLGQGLRRVLPNLTGAALLAALLGAAGVAAQESIVALPGAGERWSLARCIDEALTGSGALQAERERRRELDGLMAQARATGLPTFDITGTWSRGRDPSFALDQTFGGGEGSALDSLFGGISFIPAPEDIAAQTWWRSSLNARWELNPGRVFNAVGAAGLGIERQEAALRDLELRTIERVTAAYVALVAQSEQLAALDADLAAKAEFLAITQRRLSLGMATPLDTLRAAVAQANLRPARLRAEQSLRDTGAALNVAMGREAWAPLTVQTAAEVELAPLPSTLPAGGLSARGDLRQLSLLEAILRKNRGAQKSEHRPYLSANAAYGYVARELGELGDTGHDTWSTGVTLTVPLFDGLATRGKVKETEAAIRRTGYEYREALRQAEQELAASLGALVAARTNLAAAALNEDAAAEVLTQTQQRYALGKADYLSVLDAQTQRRLARQNGIQARAEVLTLTASLKRQLGHDPREPLADVLAALAAPRR